MNCPKCKKEIPADSLYCQFCGETIVKNKPQETKGKTVSKGWKVTTFLFLILAAVAGAMLYLEIDKANLKAAETQYVYFESPYYELKVDETVELKTSIKPAQAADKKVTYISSDTEIVTVSGNTAKANKPGRAVLTVKQGNTEYGKCVIDVLSILPESIQVSAETVDVQIGRSVDAPLLFTPKTATDKEMKYEFSKEGIVKADNAKIIGLSAGEVVVTATHISTGIKVTFNVKSIPIFANEMAASAKSTVFIGEEDFAKVTFTPEDTTDKTIKWSSNSSCIKIENGVPVAKTEGNATLTAYNAASGLSSTIEIEVLPVKAESIELTNTKGNPIQATMTANAGESIEMSVKFSPSNTTDQTAVWETSDGNIASVKKGVVSFRNAGTVTITAKTAGGEKSDSVRINVKPMPVNQNNGFILKPPGNRPCPVKVNAPLVESCYVYFKAIGGNGSDFSMFVKAGTSCEVNVPVGKYKMYYASGKTWYGVDYKFGDGTEYYTSPDTINCYTDNNYAHGSELTLYSVLNGNMSTTEIDEGSFPG